jgi:signal peptidase I
MSDTAAHRFKTYNVPFDSMEPAIAAGSDVIGDVSHYSTHRPERWDVVAFSLDGGDGRFVKRIIGLPGETIHLTAKGVKINGSFVAANSELKGCFSSFAPHDDYEFGTDPYEVPADSVFVIGDNAKVQPSDSREFGAVPIRNLEARILAAIHLTPIA